MLLLLEIWEGYQFNLALIDFAMCPHCCTHTIGNSEINPTMGMSSRSAIANLNTEKNKSVSDILGMYKMKNQLTTVIPFTFYETVTSRGGVIFFASNFKYYLTPK